MVCLVYRAKTVGPVCNRLAKVVDGLRFVRDSQPVPDGLIVRWGSVYPTEQKALNTAEAVALAKDKIASRKKLGNLAPPTYFRREDVHLPCVIRPRKHFAGKKFFVCRTPDQIDRAIDKCGRLWYATHLVDKAHEYRVFVCQGHIVAVSERFPAADGQGAAKIAWNLAMGGKLINVRYKTWPIPICKAAILAAERLGLDWCAIDLCVDTGGDVWVFEANTAPGLRNPYTMRQIARAFVYAGTHKDPGQSKGSTWQSLMHPALR